MLIDDKLVESLRRLRAVGVRSVSVVDGQMTAVDFYEMSTEEKTAVSIGMSESDMAWVKDLTKQDQVAIEKKISDDLLYGSSQ